jgi:hypothetical protein
MTTLRVAGDPPRDVEALTLANDWLRALILPELGGRVWELEDLERGRQWLWHREDVMLTAARPGAVYDDVWAGGWEELFPNDANGRFEGRDLPDHGEWWTMAWEAVEVSDHRARLSARTSVIRAQCTKEFHLSADEATLCATYRIRSLEEQPFHFLFKQHLPVSLTPSCRLTLPGGTVHAVDPSFGTLLPGPGPFRWPVAQTPTGASADLRVVPARREGHREFVYVSGLPQPWCGVEDVDAHASLRMTFDAGVLPYCWLFLSYGGWRNVYTAVLEPCSNMPKDLHEAALRGQAARLGPGEEFVTTVAVTLGASEGARQ